ncbi:lytic transglycosylase domain-containing protein [Salirhabdus salicampi]|uniref:lytic transglycosylase domain-containing protein n=1 Tax=Salirhabdus salicampi TaxID=476102 RepID=UPI0020C3783C|nr:transglycosylase SLT domain-containing protein [Salirhabdus salicampi]MCP8616882.1 transglycosylase SLT domain-containing protein [Salirhabdus salicampi]
MKLKRSDVHLFIVISYMTICFVTVFHLYSNQNSSLKRHNEQLQRENEKLTAINNYLSSSSKEILQLNGYHDWPHLLNEADRMVNDSNDQFHKEWAIYLTAEAQKYDIDPFLVYELLKVETGKTFDPELVGPKTKYGRAYGLGQFMKNTAPWVADMGNLPYKDELLFDPYYSIQLTLVYLDFLYDRYGNWNEALTAYHRGMGGLQQYQQENGHAKSWYAVKIQKNAKTYQRTALAQ